jgi:hypothetical protein
MLPVSFLLFRNIPYQQTVVCQGNLLRQLASRRSILIIVGK